MIPSTMRAAVLHGVNDLRLEEVPVPRPGAGEVLVRVAANGICGSDLHFYERGRIGSFVVDRPLLEPVVPAASSLQPRSVEAR